MLFGEKQRENQKRGGNRTIERGTGKDRRGQERGQGMNKAGHQVRRGSEPRRLGTSLGSQKWL